MQDEVLGRNDSEWLRQAESQRLFIAPSRRVPGLSISNLFRDFC
jgi:hypothetical protein